MISALLCQSLFSTSVMMPEISWNHPEVLRQEEEKPSGSMEEARKRSKNISRQMAEIQSALKKNRYILIQLERKYDSQKEALSRKQETAAAMKQKVRKEIKHSQSGKTSWKQKADLEEKAKLLTALFKEEEELQAYTECLQGWMEYYQDKNQSLEAHYQGLQNANHELKESRDVPEFKEGGKFNPEKLISPDCKITDYDSNAARQDQPEKADPQAAGENFNKEEDAKADQDSNENFQQEQPVLKSAESSKAYNVLKAEKAQNGLKEQASQETADQQDPGKVQPNTGSTKRGTSFVKACPPEDLDVSAFDLDLNLASGSLILPVQGVVSGGTWAYYGGGMHLGLDLAAPMYSPLRAPASGIIVYADNPVDSNCGYLGNWCGWPQGGGNTIAMLCVVNGQLLAITFAHLSNTLYVTAGQQVQQGELMALSGNSGNSTGPHTHVEVFVLNCTLQEAVTYFSYGADFSFGCGFSAPATCSGYACRIRPESVFF